MKQKVFVTGGTGYIGRRLIERLMQHGFEVLALVRNGSEKKLPTGTTIIFGNALEANTFHNSIPNECTFIHLVGVAHPSPAKKQQFIDIDLASIKASVTAAKNKNIAQFIYLSVAPNNIMKEYAAVRMEGEQLVRENFPNTTFVRPFYVLGPGHRWPLLLIPLFQMASLSKSGKEKVQRLGLVWIGQMINCLINVIEHPATGIRVIEVADIKKFSKKY